MVSGPSERAGFIDAPLIGLANRPRSATVPPTAIAALWPMLRLSVAVLSMMLTRMKVSTISITSDRHSPPGTAIGYVPPVLTCPNTSCRNHVAASAPASCDTQ